MTPPVVVDTEHAVLETEPPVAAAPRTLAQWLAHADTLHPRGIDMGLHRVRQVREAMRLTPRVPVITVTGTNGKGSTCAMLEAMLRAAGYRVGLYTSPHLVRWNERVRVDGRPLADRPLAEAFEQVERARDGVPLTPFEFGTLAAVAAMQRAQVEVMVLEVGLGGRLDAVNVFDADCAVLTSVGLDHTDYLGPTRETIGREKAGIFRAGRVAVCGDIDPPHSVGEVARALGADLQTVGVDYGFALRSDAWRWRGPGGGFDRLRLPGMPGEHQFFNAASAIAALWALRDRLAVSRTDISQGLANVSLRGRFQRIRGRCETVLDVAHNPHAAQRLAALLAAHPVHGRTHAVFGMLGDKDAVGTAAAMSEVVDHWHACGLPGDRGTDAARTLGALHAAGVRGTIAGHADPVIAWRRAVDWSGPDDRIVVFGSFVTVGAVMAHIGPAAEVSPGR